MNLLVHAYSRPFSIETSRRSDSGPQTSTNTTVQDFGSGAIVVPVAGQKLSSDSLYALVNRVSKQAGVPFSGVKTGVNTKGIDLGSNNIRALKKPEVALLVGQGVNASEAGEVWFLLSEQLNLPLSKIDISNVGRINRERYNTIVLVGGQYNSLAKTIMGKLKSWVENGGTLITTKNATEWAIRQSLVKENLLASSPSARIDTPRVATFPKTADRTTPNEAKTDPVKAMRTGSRQTGSRQTGSILRIFHSKKAPGRWLILFTRPTWTLPTPSDSGLRIGRFSFFAMALRSLNQVVVPTERW
ncbi:hypothetical protein [Spirosoma validum]|uniref:Uncharacterized protein n=1 Tax=Spirosoma validum TaxID=2771355 RepID=A0A927GDP8_9BACT|nr:hypothetical protein [Spirosoma validum]MBD2753893.1 hypothetical protein [Spirosoma validum]